MEQRLRVLRGAQYAAARSTLRRAVRCGAQYAAARSTLRPSRFNSLQSHHFGVELEGVLDVCVPITPIVRAVEAAIGVRDLLLAQVARVVAFVSASLRNSNVNVAIVVTPVLME
jgi:hypothetical protein